MLERTIKNLTERKEYLQRNYFKQSDNYLNFLDLTNTWNDRLEKISKKHRGIQERLTGAIHELKIVIDILKQEKRELEEIEEMELQRQYEEYRLEKYYNDGIEKVNLVYEKNDLEEVPF